MSRTQRIIFVGHTCIDRNVSEHARYESWGSPALYMSDYLERLHGIRAGIISTYGRDLLQYAGHYDLLNAPIDGRSMVYQNDTSRVPRTQRCLLNEGDSPPVLDESTRRTLSEADIIVMAPLSPSYTAQFVGSLMDCLSPECLKVCCPQGYFRQVEADGSVTPRIFEEADGILARFDLILLSEEDHPTATEQAIGWKISGVSGHCIVTQGSKGASIVSDQGLHEIPTEPIRPADIIDSVGCGDVFAAAVMLDFRDHGDIVQAIKGGHVAAREKLLSVNRDAGSI